jgi:protein O-GlcNAc transferase
MTQEKILHLGNDIQISLPDSLDLISSYVLEEKLDWFESEILFVRSIISNGDYVIDIGANYGVYTLSAAKIIGPHGKVFAFEPAKKTAYTLLKSIEINKFNNIDLKTLGLSNKVGSARLSLNENSELNSLIEMNANPASSEIVSISTLDECMDSFNWKEEIAFVKIDAEGEEKNIIKGGRRFFNSKSPLVMFEIKDGLRLHLELIEEFQSIGYKVYKLIPGLNALIPWKENEKPDAYQLNLFCCKSDKAEQLELDGFLIQNIIEDMDEIHKQGITQEKVIDTDICNHLNYYTPSLLALTKIWDKKITEINPKILRCLNLFRLYQTTSKTSERYKFLKMAFDLIYSACQTDCKFLRLSTLARIALDLGQREIAVNALNVLIENIENTKILDINEPFLLPSDDFDEIQSPENPLNLILSSILITLEKNQYFSSYYSGPKTLDRLKAIMDLGFADDEIIRRIDLINRRFPN